MSDNPRAELRRRRSSVAYDPARDTFTEIPNTVPEDAVVDTGNTVSSPSEKAMSSSPAQGKTISIGNRKRKLSSSVEESKTSKTNESQVMHTSSSPKRRRPSPQHSEVQHSSPKINSPAKGPPRSVADLPRVPRKPREDGELSAGSRIPSAYNRRPDIDRGQDRDRRRPNGHSNARRRSQSPSRNSSNLYRRRSPPRARERTRSPSPIRASPPREPVTRPGGARGRGRNVLVEQQRLAAERERQQASIQSQTNRGVQDVSNQFYNARPEWVKERGRDWRKNESQIKGLRSYNNWVKSCLIQKFSAEQKTEPEELGWGEEAKEPEQVKPLIILDVGCGKGGDLGKWQLAPQPVGLYVGLDPADTSIQQASERYHQMRRGRKPIFDARFVTKDCFGEWIGDVDIVREVGIDSNAGNGVIGRFMGGGFDVVTMMFSMHYAFESEGKVQMMLRNVAGSLRKGGRFIGVVPNSDALAEQIRSWYSSRPIKEKSENRTSSTDQQKEHGEANDTDDESPSWGNSIYNIRFPSHPHPTASLDQSGVFRPPFSWKYTYWMAEAVDVPEFVVPWEAFRALAEGFNLEQRYRKPFLEIWDAERHDREMSDLAGRMGVVAHGPGGEENLRMSEEEKEAVSLYHAFCFVKV